MGIAHQLVKEGHSVKVWIQKPDYKWTGKGIVERVASFRPHISGSQLIVGDMVGFGRHRNLFDRLNKPVIGVDPFCDAAELDRQKGLQLFKETGIKIPKSWSFPSIETARLGKWPKENVVLKPSGNIDTAKTFICKDEESVDYALEQYDKEQAIIIQEFVEGVEVSTEGWFNGRDWITPFNHTFEEKKFLVGDLGPNTGCMGNVVMATKGNKITEATLGRLTTILRKAGIVGPIDVNCIINESGIYVIEPTCRFGYDAVEALIEGLQESTADLLFETALGTKKEMKITKDYMIAVRLSIPPWPLADTNGAKPGKPVLGVNQHNLPHLFLTDVHFDDKMYLASMGDGVVLKATARGRTVREAQRRVYRTLENLQVQDKQYRIDIGDRVDKDLARLREWGYL